MVVNAGQSLDYTVRRNIDGCYTRKLRMATTISWKDKVTYAQMYIGMPKMYE